jgi:hypothetical protein
MMIHTTSDEQLKPHEMIPHLDGHTVRLAPDVRQLDTGEHGWGQDKPVKILYGGALRMLIQV